MLNRSDEWCYLHLPFFKKAAFFDREKRLLNVAKQMFSDEQNSVVFSAEDLQPDCVSAAQLWFETTGIQNLIPHIVEAKCQNSAVPHPLELVPANNSLGWIVSNPPFGIRLSNNSQGGTENLYRDFSNRIVSLTNKTSSSHSSEMKSWLGVVLCPDEDCWRILQSRLSGWHQKCEHFMLGGLDIRAFYFGRAEK
jgi:23S rRNA G2445 N2-methylase RlmL